MQETIKLISIGVAGLVLGIGQVFTFLKTKKQETEVKDIIKTLKKEQEEMHDKCFYRKYAKSKLLLEQQIRAIKIYINNIEAMTTNGFIEIAKKYCKTDEEYTKAYDDHKKAMEIAIYRSKQVAFYFLEQDQYITKNPSDLFQTIDTQAREIYATARATFDQMYPFGITPSRDLLKQESIASEESILNEIKKGLKHAVELEKAFYEKEND